MILDKRADLGHGDVKKLLFSLSVPTITSQIVNMLYNLVDRVFIGHMQPAETVGKLALTGVGVCLPIIMVISAFASLMAIGGAPRASIAEGAGESEKSERIMGNCLTMLVITALVLTVLFESFAEPLLLMFGASENTIGYALDYMRIYALGTIFVQLTLGMNAYITAQGFATVSMKTVLIGALLNTALDPLFIFVLGLGVRGAALATVISQAVSAVWVITFLTGKKTRWYLKRENLHVDAKIVLPCIALGLSPFVMQSTESLIAICFNSSLLRYGGDMAVGTMTVLTSIMQFSNMPLQGLTQGAQPIVSYNFGAKNAKRVRDAYFCLLRACFTYSMAIWLLVEFFPRAFILIFNNDPALVEYAAWGRAHLHGVQRYFRHPDRLPADVCGARQREDVALPRRVAQDHPAHPAHLYSAALFRGQGVRGVPGRARGGLRRGGADELHILSPVPPLNARVGRCGSDWGAVKKIFNAKIKGEGTPSPFIFYTWPPLSIGSFSRNSIVIHQMPARPTSV